MEVLCKPFQAEQHEGRGCGRGGGRSGGSSGVGEGVDGEQGTGELRGTLGVKVKDSRFSTGGTPRLK